LAEDVMGEEPTGFSALSLAVRQIRERFDVASASVWRQADRGRVRLTASALEDGSVVAEPVTVYFDDEDLLEVDASGHSVIIPSSLGKNFSAVFPESARTLVVRLGDASEAMGFATVTTITPRSWSASEIDEFKSVTPILHNLAVRLWVEQQSSRREAMLETVNRVSSIATQADSNTAHESRVEILSVVRGFFGATAAGFWQRHGAGFRLVLRVDDDGSSTGRGESVSVTEEQLEALSKEGYAVAHVGSLESNLDLPFRPEVVALMVSIEARGEMTGVLSLVRPGGRRWSDDEIAGARSAASVIGQMTLRLKAEHQLRERMSLEEIVSGVASNMADATVDNVDKKLEHLLHCWSTTSISTLLRCGDSRGPDRCAAWPSITRDTMTSKGSPLLRSIPVSCPRVAGYFYQ